MIIEITNVFNESQIKEIKILFDKMFNTDFDVSIENLIVTFTDN